LIVNYLTNNKKGNKAVTDPLHSFTDGRLWRPSIKQKSGLRDWGEHPIAVMGHFGLCSLASKIATNPNDF
jgi:hypothetical protein